MHCVIIVYCRSWNHPRPRCPSASPRAKPPSASVHRRLQPILQLRSPLRRDSHRCAGSSRRGACRPPLDRRHNLTGRDEQPSVAAVEHLLPRGAAFCQAKPGDRPRGVGTHVRAWVSVDAVSGCGRRERARRWGRTYLAARGGHARFQRKRRVHQPEPRPPVRAKESGGAKWGCGVVGCGMMDSVSRWQAGRRSRGDAPDRHGVPDDVHRGGEAGGVDVCGDAQRKERREQPSIAERRVKHIEVISLVDPTRALARGLNLHVDEERRAGPRERAMDVEHVFGRKEPREWTLRSRAACIGTDRPSSTTISHTVTASSSSPFGRAFCVPGV